MNTSTPHKLSFIFSSPVPAIVAGAILMIGSSAHAQTNVSLNTFDNGTDGMIRESHPTTTLSPALELRQQPTVSRRSSLALGFDTSSITGTVTDATFSFTTRVFNELSAPAEIYGVVQGFEVSEVGFSSLTYNNAPWLTGADADFQTDDLRSGAVTLLGTISPTSTGNSTVVTSANFVNWLNSDTDGWSVIYMQAGIDGGNNTTFNYLAGASDSLTSGQIYPTLDATVIPEPRNIALMFGSAIFFIAFYRRRRKQS